MIFLWLSLLLLPFLGKCVEINPQLHYNQLRFPWGVNFKYTGLLHHNLARVWIVTKFNLPPKNRVHFPPVNLVPDCNFTTTPGTAHNDSHQSHLRTFSIFGPSMDTDCNRRVKLRNHCEDSLPAFTLVKTREDYYRKKLIALVDEGLYAPLESYRSLRRRSKQFASLVICAVTGLVTLAIEGISSYL